MEPAELWRQHHDVCMQAMARYRLAPDEALSLSWDAAVECAKSYDPKRGRVEPRLHFTARKVAARWVRSNTLVYRYRQLGAACVGIEGHCDDSCFERDWLTSDVDVEEQVERARTKQRAWDAIEGLSKRHQTALKLWMRGEPLDTAMALLGVTRQRVSQLNLESIARIKQAITQS